MIGRLCERFGVGGRVRQAALRAQERAMHDNLLADGKRYGQ